jgi:hypothetical protein
MKCLTLLTATMLTVVAACSPGGSPQAPASSAQPAAGAPAARQTVQASFDSLRSDGYLITNVTDLTDAEQLEIWPNQGASPYLLITLQKGSSTAVCSSSTYNFIITLNDASAKNANLCYKR